MAFLDNSGDIILDAVLTDTGRMRLAKGDGSFRITQFAFGDDEINYGLYNKNHPSGSAYFDLDILQTPILEAFTNNTSVLKFQLMSNMRNDLLFLPTLLLNTLVKPTGSGYSGYLLVSNAATKTSTSTDPTGFLDGISSDSGYGSLVIDQGLNSNQTDLTISLKDSDPTLYESQYSIELNYNLMRLKIGSQLLEPTSIDDDGFATYILDEATNSNAIRSLQVESVGTAIESTPLLGTRGSRLTFNLQASSQVQISTEIFTRLGGTFNGTSIGLAASTYYIDTSVVVRGMTTGVSTTVPVKLVKVQ